MRGDEQPKYRFPLVAFDDVKLTSTGLYLVKGLIPREGLIVAYGAPKCGKSFLVFDIVAHIACGWDYRGRRTKQGTVVYVACEGERGLSARIEAFRREKMGDQTEPPALRLLTTRLGLASDAPVLISDLRAQLGDQGCAVIVIDTLNRSLEGSESDDRDMGSYVKACDLVREAFGCAVIAIHHSGVDASRPRGHTSLTGAADAQIAVKRDAAGQIVAKVEWMKDGPEGDEIVSKLKVVEVGFDQDGEPITSCIVEPVEGMGIRAEKKPKIAGAAKIALDMLGNAIDTGGEVPPASNHIPANRRAVREAIWRQYCYEGSISAGDTQAAKQKAFKRAADALQSGGAIGVWNEWVWVA